MFMSYCIQFPCTIYYYNISYELWPFDWSLSDMYTLLIHEINYWKQLFHSLFKWHICYYIKSLFLVGDVAILNSSLLRSPNFDSLSCPLKPRVPPSFLSSKSLLVDICSSFPLLSGTSVGLLGKDFDIEPYTANA